MMSQRRAGRGFTLIELLIVIAIIAIISIIVILVLNPAELLRESRDAERLSDMSTLKNAVSLYIVSGGVALGTASTSYVSLPDAAATSSVGNQCQAQDPLALPAGWSYHCPASSTYKAIDGTGWVPINFTSISVGSPIANLPIDPLNASSTGNYFSYFTSGSNYEISVPFESTKYSPLASVDGGIYANLYEQGGSLSLVPLDYTGGGSSAGNPNGYVDERSITIAAAQASGTLSSFPMLFSGTYSWLAASSSGGNVQNASGYDISFTSDPTCSTALNFETESYTASNGTIVDWVNVPTMQGNAVIYICYDAPGITTNQSHASSTWNSNYIAVYHYANPGGILSTNDSTANANNGVNSSGAVTTGEIDGGLSLSGASNVLASTISGNWPQGSVTLSYWIKPSNVAGSEYVTDAAVGGSDNKFSTLVGYQSGFFNIFAGAYPCSGTAANTELSATTSAWQYVTYQSNGSTVVGYLNGAQKFSCSGNLNTGGTITKFDVGNAIAGGAQYSGSLDEAEISNVALSSQWVLSEYNNQSSPSTFYTVGSATTP